MRCATRIVLPIATLALTTLSAGLRAAEGQWYLAPGAQWMEFDSSTGLDDGVGFFAGLGFQLTDRLSLELNTFDLDADATAGGEIDLDHYKFDVLYDIDTSNEKWRPFVVAGMGNTDFDGDNDTLLNVGAGIKYALSSKWEWRTAVRNFSYFGRDGKNSDIGIDTALVYYFGDSGSSSRPVASRTETPAPTPAPARRDSDGDGVYDDEDQCPDTPRNYAVDENGCPIPVEEVARVELLVNFDFDRSEVKPQYFDEIEEVADFMEQYPDTMIELEGHTDSVGTDAYNQGLSERRAAAVRQVLIDRFDVQGSRISTVGYGESQPVASNSTSAGRAQNRRVITVIIKTLQRYQPR